MCGIVSCVGDKEASQVLLNGWRRLEYRGYDSAGLSLIGRDALLSVKRPGKVAALNQAVREELSPEKNELCRIGVALPAGLPMGRLPR